MNRSRIHSSVLLVEDSADDQELARVALEHIPMTCRMVVVNDGEEALTYLNPCAMDSRELPHLVFLDFHLPKLNGIEVLTHWRSVPSLRYLPVVMLSTSDQPDDVAQAYLAGANGYIVKPVGLEPFIDTFSRVCSYWLGLNETLRHGRVD